MQINSRRLRESGCNDEFQWQLTYCNSSSGGLKPNRVNCDAAASIYLCPGLAAHNVPHLHHTVCVTGNDGSSGEVHVEGLHSVVVAEERLHTQTCARVPHRDGLVTRGSHEERGVGNPADLVHGVDVAAERVELVARVEVPESGGLIKRSREGEVAAVVELHIPDGLRVTREFGRAPLLREVPNLGVVVGARGTEERARGVEGARGEPALVTLAGHDELA